MREIEIPSVPAPSRDRGDLARRTEEALAERLTHEKSFLAARAGTTLDIPVLTLELPARGTRTLGPDALAQAIAEALRQERRQR